MATPPFQPTRSALGRKVFLTLAGFTLLSTVCTGIIATLAERRHERDRFQVLAHSNAAFVDTSLLPPSLSLARKLSEVIGIAVAFRLPDGALVIGAGDPRLWSDLIGRLPATGEQVSSARGWELRASRLRSGVEMLFARALPDWRPAWRPWLFAALLVFPSLALLPALALARDVVDPLQRLGAWLPLLRLDHVENESAQGGLPRDLLAREDEIGDLARALHQARLRLRQEITLRQQSERMATFGRMATSLAHEIKNPAAAISLHADLLRASPPGEADLTLSLDSIRSAAERIVVLVHQWLFVVRPTPPRRELHDLRDVVASTLSALSSFASHQGVEFTEVNRPRTPIRLQIDRIRIEHALRNVLVNACEAMPMGGTVEIDWQSVSPLTLSVRDEGFGFSPEALVRGGEAFFSTKEGGMGLGLNLAAEVIRAHGGTIDLKNLPPPAGAAVTLSFSASQPE